MKTLLQLLVLATIISSGSNQLMAQWVQTGPEGGVVQCLTVKDTILFAGTEVGGVLRSTNNGTSWNYTNSTIGHPLCFAVSGPNLFVGGYNEVELSTDNGYSWAIVNTGMPFTTVRSLVVSDSNIFAGTDDGVFLSTNNGSNWISVNTGLPPSTGISSLAVNDTNIFAGTDGRGVFRSTNNGATWTAVNDTLLDSAYVWCLTVMDGYLFAGAGGVYRSSNNGDNWTAVNTGLTDPGVTSFAVSGRTLFAGTAHGGVCRTTDYGGNWTAVNTGLTNRYIYALTTNGTNLFAGTWGSGVFRSMNNGASWTPVNTGMKNTVLFDFVVSGTNLFAGGYGGVIRSTNYGDSWTNVNNGLTNLNVKSLAISGTNLFAGSYRGWSGAVDLSTDNGSSWYSVLTGGPSDTLAGVRSLAFSGTNLFAGTAGNGLLRTPDFGNTWYSVNTGLTDSVINAFVVRDTNLFVGTNSGGIFLSTDMGNSWTSVNTGLTDLCVHALAASDANIFAGTDSGGVFRSNNNGTSWIPVNNGINPHPSLGIKVLSLAVSDTSLFAGTWGRGVFLTLNNGEKWTNVNTGQVNSTINTLTVSDTFLFAGTHGRSVWRSPLSELVAQVNIPPFLVNTIPDTNLTEDSGTHLVVSNLNNIFGDTNDTLTFTATVIGNSITANVSDSTLEILTVQDSSGINSVTVNALDGEYSIEDTFFVTITPVNDPPVVSAIPGIVFPEDSSYILDLDTMVIDVDHDTTEISWFASFPTNIIANIQQQLDKRIVQKSRQILEVNRKELKNINDGRENQTEIKSEKIFKQRSGLNVKPVKNLHSEAVTEYKEEQSEPKVIRRKEKTFPDHIQEPLRDPYISLKFPESTSSPGISILSITQGDNDSLIIAIDSLTHLVTITATLNFNGLDIPVIFTAVDDSGASDSDTTTISVYPVNDPPMISQLPELTFDEDDTLNYPISNWFPFVNDPETPVGELSYFVLPGNHVMGSSGNAVFFFYAEENWFGRDTLQLVVTDTVLSDTANIYVNVLPINDPPIIGDNFPYLIEFQSDSSFVFDLDTVVVDIDDPVEALDWSVLGASEVRVDIDSSTHECSISLPSNRNIVIDTLHFVVEDTSFAADTSDYVIVRVVITTVVHFLNELPETFSLSQNYPNPFNPVTHIRFGLPVASDVKIDVYNILGQNVISLVDERKEPGYHVIEFNGNSLGSAIYIYRIQAGDYVDVKKMILMK
jgi:hypothetical protein